VETLLTLLIFEPPQKFIPKFDINNLATPVWMRGFKTKILNILGILIYYIDFSGNQGYLLFVHNYLVSRMISLSLALKQKP
jgi:hypothetical protein